MTTPLTLAQEGSPPPSPPPSQGPRVPGAPSAGEGTALQPGAPGQPPAAPQGGGGGFNLLLMLAAVMIFFVLITSMSGRKERRRREQLLTSIKRMDRVQTLGGIIGTVVEIHGPELVLRVDESSNTRIRFARSAVQQVMNKEAEPAGPKDAKDKAGASA